MSPAGWAGCSWDVQRMYLEGLKAEGLLNLGGGEQQQPEEDLSGLPDGGPVIRLVEAARESIDIKAMQEQLAATR